LNSEDKMSDSAWAAATVTIAWQVVIWSVILYKDKNKTKIMKILNENELFIMQKSNDFDDLIIQKQEKFSQSWDEV
jgi:predicted nuclease of predicted toxin-antitoxin system